MRKLPSPLRTLTLASALLLTGQATRAANLTVNTLADVVAAADGLCSLREAITASDVNVASGAVAGECAAGAPFPAGDRILFAVAGIVQPTAANGPLPPLTDGRLMLDGWSAPGAGSNLPPRVGVDGSLLGIDNGLTLTSERNVIRGLAILNWGNNGIRIEGTGAVANRVQGCRIGTNALGTQARPNHDGVSISAGAQSNLIGTDGDGNPDRAERNVIGGNEEDGVSITGEGTSFNRVAGNRIGTTADGLAALPNGHDGVALGLFTSDNIIGTDGSGDPFDIREGNLISGNAMNGINDFAGVRTVVTGNWIGVDATGGAALANLIGVQVLDAVSGIRIGTDGDGVADAEERNVISGNTVAGIDLRGNDQSVAGNFIGTDATGTLAVPNSVGVNADGGPLGTSGDMTIGGPSAAFRNVIAGNSQGLAVLAFDVIVECNYFGTDATGTAAVPNGIGISLTIATNAVVKSNLLAFNTTALSSGDPANLVVNDNSIAGNVDGVTWNAAADLDATGNWWGDASGPTQPGNPGGVGDTASQTGTGAILYTPWLGAPPPPCAP